MHKKLLEEDGFSDNMQEWERKALEDYLESIAHEVRTSEMNFLVLCTLTTFLQYKVTYPIAYQGREPIKVSELLGGVRVHDAEVIIKPGNVIGTIFRAILTIQPPFDFYTTSVPMSRTDITRE